MSDAEEPDLCGRMTAQQAFGRSIIIPVDLIGARFNVNGDELALVLCRVR